jgi:hypothetical protein
MSCLVEQSTYDLYVGQRHVEVGGQVCVPDHAHVGQEQCAQVALVRGEVPHTRAFRVHLLGRQENQLVCKGEFVNHISIGEVGDRIKEKTHRKQVTYCL